MRRKQLKKPWTHFNLTPTVCGRLSPQSDVRWEGQALILSVNKVNFSRRRSRFVDGMLIRGSPPQPRPSPSLCLHWALEGPAYCLADVNSDLPGRPGNQASMDSLPRPFPAPQYPASSSEEVAIWGREMRWQDSPSEINSALCGSLDNGPVCPAHPLVCFG